MQKYLVPIKPDNLFSRESLIDKISSKLQRQTQLIFIKAPAGYGKTYLMTDIAHRLEQQHKLVVWLSCNEDDDISDSFFGYFLNELKSKKLIDEQLVYDENISVVRFTNRLFEQLETLDQKVSFFFDEFHQISNPRVIDFISELCLHSPRNIKVFIASKISAPFASAKAIKSEKIIQINQADLSFSRDEIKHISQQSSLNTLSDIEIELVVNRTGGWPAIVGPSIYSDDWKMKTRDWVKEFSNANMSLAEYFYQDILATLTQTDKQHLISLSITEYLCDDLIEALIGEKDFTQRIINIVPITQLHDPALPANMQSFTIHPLMREFLKKELISKQQSQLDKLHQKAGSWLLQQQKYFAAAEQFLEAKLVDDAVAIIEEKGVEIVATSGDFPGFKKLINKLPHNVLYSNPEILTLLGWMYALNYQPNNALKVIELMAKTVQQYPELAADFHCIMVALKGAIGLFTDTVFEHEESFKKQLADSPLPIPYAEISILAEYCLLALHNNDFDLVNNLFSDAELFAGGGKLLDGTVMIKVAQATMELSFGNLEKTLQICDQTDEFIQQKIGESLLGNIVRVMRGIIAYYQGNLSFSRAAFTKSGAIISYINEPSILSWYYAIHLQLLTDLGEQEQKELLIEQFSDLVKPRKLTFSKIPLVYEIIEHYFASGNQDDALLLYQNFKDVLASSQYKSGHILVNEELLDALVLVNQQQYEQAKQIVDGQSKLYEQAGRVLQQLNCVIQLVNINILSASPIIAKKHLKKAVSLAAAKQILQPFARLHRIAINYLQGWSSSELSPIRKAFIINVCDSFAGQSVKESFNDQSIEPLSQKEKNVMVLLGQGYSNQQIADELFLSINTVKSHLKVAYKKLGVSNRIQAAKLFTGTSVTE